MLSTVLPLSALSDSEWRDIAAGRAQPLAYRPNELPAGAARKRRGRGDQNDDRERQQRPEERTFGRQQPLTVENSAPFHHVRDFGLDPRAGLAKRRLHGSALQLLLDSNQPRPLTIDHPDGQQHEQAERDGDNHEDQHDDGGYDQELADERHRGTGAEEIGPLVHVRNHLTQAPNRTAAQARERREVDRVETPQAETGGLPIPEVGREGDAVAAVTEERAAEHREKEHELRGDEHQERAEENLVRERRGEEQPEHCRTWPMEPVGRIVHTRDAQLASRTVRVNAVHRSRLPGEHERALLDPHGLNREIGLYPSERVAVPERDFRNEDERHRADENRRGDHAEVAAVEGADPRQGRYWL